MDAVFVTTILYDAFVVTVSQMGSFLMECQVGDVASKRREAKSLTGVESATVDSS